MKRFLCHWSSLVGLMVALTSFVGCFSPSFTAKDLNPLDGSAQNTSYLKEVGMPYYLPKPYLIVTKNIRYIPTATIGLTSVPSNIFPSDNSKSATPTPSGAKGDNGSPSPTKAPSPTKTPTPTKAPAVDAGEHAEATAAQKAPPDVIGQAGADAPQPSPTPVGSSTQTGKSQLVPGTGDNVSDGLVPTTFYTYHIEYLPDTTKKYGLVIKGGMGEARANINLVNGWMFTGTGPLYLSNSTTANTATAVGQVSGTILQDVLGAFFPASSAAKAAATVAKTVATGKYDTPAGTNALPDLNTINNYAEIYVYEIDVAGGQLKEVKHQCFTREAYELEQASMSAPTPRPTPKAALDQKDATTLIQGMIRNAGLDKIVNPDTLKVQQPSGELQLVINFQPGKTMEGDGLIALKASLAGITASYVSENNIDVSGIIAPEIDSAPAGPAGPAGAPTPIPTH